MKIRLLTQEDWKIWKELRLDALKNVPASFGSSYTEEVNSPDSVFQDHLNKNAIFGAFADNMLIGSIGFYSLDSLKTKHRGMLWGMYVQSEYRGRGVANSLMEAVISYARPRVMQLHLACATSNLGAVKFYQKHGFNIYGTEPRALKIGEVFFDEYLMVLELMK